MLITEPKSGEGADSLFNCSNCSVGIRFLRTLVMPMQTGFSPLSRMSTVNKAIPAQVRHSLSLGKYSTGDPCGLFGGRGGCGIGGFGFMNLNKIQWILSKRIKIKNKTTTDIIRAQRMQRSITITSDEVPNKICQFFASSPSCDDYILKKITFLKN